MALCVAVTTQNRLRHWASRRQINSKKKEAVREWELHRPPSVRKKHKKGVFSPATLPMLGNTVSQVCSLSSSIIRTQM
jgi:hypothetical protein